MLRKLLSAAAVSSLLIAGTLSAARAADMGMPLKAPPPPPPPVYSWTGCYVDAGVGYGLWNQDKYEFSNVTGVVETASTTDGGRGWLGRFGGGCDYQFGGGWSSWVIGAFGDYDVMDLKGTISGIGADMGVPTFGDEKESGAWYAGGRVGYLINPGLLGYVDGGYTQTRFGSITLMPETATPLAGPRGLPANTYNGWFVGGGYEYALNFAWVPIRGLFWKTEYRFSQYDSANLAIMNLATGAVGTSSINSKPFVQTITSSIVWRFNWFGQ